MFFLYALLFPLCVFLGYRLGKFLLAKYMRGDEPVPYEEPVEMVETATPAVPYEPTVAATSTSFTLDTLIDASVADLTTKIEEDLFKTAPVLVEPIVNDYYYQKWSWEPGIFATAETPAKKVTKKATKKKTAAKRKPKSKKKS